MLSNKHLKYNNKSNRMCIVCTLHAKLNNIKQSRVNTTSSTDAYKRMDTFSFSFGVLAHGFLVCESNEGIGTIICNQSTIRRRYIKFKLHVLFTISHKINLSLLKVDITTNNIYFGKYLMP